MVLGSKHTEKPKSSWSEGEVSSGETGSKQPFSKKLKRNCAKWWWLYLLILIIVIVVVVVPIIFVGIKNIAQKSINDATVTVDHQTQTNPGPNSFDLQINTTVHSSSSHKATVEGFNASFYLLDTKPDIKPFIYANFPAVDSADVSLVNITQKSVPVADMQQFINYNTLVLNSETFQIGVKGNTHVVLSGLPKYSVTYDKVVTMKGFNKLKGFKIQTIQFHIPPLFDGATMTGKVTMYNPSVISAQFGNVSMNLFANGTFLGTSLLEYVDFKPGNNSYDMRSYINTTLALQYIHDNVLDLEIIGNSSVNIGGQHLVYFEEALKTNTIQYRLNITEATSNNSTS